jgi:hypothetical protein
MKTKHLVWVGRSRTRRASVALHGAGPSGRDPDEDGAEAPQDRRGPSETYYLTDPHIRPSVVAGATSTVGCLHPARVGSRKPSASRICARCRFTCRPVQSYSESSSGGTLTCWAT